MEFIFLAVIGFVAFKAVKTRIKKRKLKAVAQDITKTFVQTATGIIEADEAKTSERDILASNAIMANLVGFIGALRDAYGISYKSGSFAERYAQELTNNNYGYLNKAHGYIAKSLKHERSVDNFGNVLMEFLHNPPPEFEKNHVKSSMMLCLLLMLCSCAKDVVNDVPMQQPLVVEQESVSEKAARQAKYKELTLLSIREVFKCGFSKAKVFDDKVSDAMTIAKVLAVHCRQQLDESTINHMLSEERKPKEPVLIPARFTDSYPEQMLGVVLKSRTLNR